MGEFSRADTLHRLVKQMLDSGAVTSLEEAERIFRGYKLILSIDELEAQQPIHQATLLTCLALARRVFLGGVTVSGKIEVPLAIPLQFGATLAKAVSALGGQTGFNLNNTPTVFIGGNPRPRKNRFQIRTTASGWRGGIVPAHSEFSLNGDSAMPLTAMLCAALAVNEAFLSVRQEAPAAGSRMSGLSLWHPDQNRDWLDDNSDGPTLSFLPSHLWLIGLGHLGQAYLWALGLLPYTKTSNLELVLQDIDSITPSNESTSILTDSSLVGQKKTRVMATWAERRGFSTVIHERLFDKSFSRLDSEPAVCLCGLDNAMGRQALDQVGFKFIVEAGLGRGFSDFRTIRLHTLPGARTAADIWKIPPTIEDVPMNAAYQTMIDKKELDRCGVTVLAGKAVGAPFVGALAASLAISEILRLLHQGPLYQLIDLDMASIEHRSAIPHALNFSNFNPGYVAV